jgi:hypothetical protein
MRLNNLLLLLLLILLIIAVSYIIFILFNTQVYRPRRVKEYRYDNEPINDVTYIYKNDSYPIWWGAHNVNWGPHYMRPYPSYDLRHDPIHVHNQINNNHKHNYMHISKPDSFMSGSDENMYSSA